MLDYDDSLLKLAFNRLSAVRVDGDWEAWVGFFLDGVEAAARDAERGIVAMASLINADRQRLLAAPRLGVGALRLLVRGTMAGVVR